ncbi:beta-galactosidase [Paenibacillus sp. SYP-B4298]|uniref:beta-galactosidase n=1 Tax=Paenibacillus sp. SYP-B4298 TaxID=2996034 RepID=UPI0022DDCDFA|nr:beta-galactosidase [Paenibacillus sp. SYP-B4298]
MRQTQQEFIPFGFQYYRSPTPYRDQWERDLRQLAELGFNSVKYWVQWRSSTPEPNVYRFDDIQELMDLAHRYGLKVILNVIFDVAPAWFDRTYPDARMVTADGAVLAPRALSYRQIGGAPGPCYHHRPAQQAKDEFLEAAVQQFKDHPALWVWDLWNEPELTTGIKRTLSYDNQVCYCEHSMEAFHRWLEDRYGTLERLNERWQRTYPQWSEIEAPRGQAVFADLVDWRLFMSEALTDDLKRRVAVVKRNDQAHQVMVHTVPAPIFNLITAGSDDFKLAEPCDLFGNSLGSSAWSADLLISAAKGKKIINSEIHALPGDMALKPKKLSLQELKRHVLVPLARGITGFLFWQYRPEVLGHEAPAWGSTYLDGSVTPWLEDMARLNRAIQSRADRLARARRPSDRIAIWFSSAGQIASFGIYAHLDAYHDSVQGVHKLLHDLGYKVEFVSDQDLTSEGLADYACLILPHPLYLDERMAQTLEQWVAGGGLLLSESGFGSIQAENGSHSYTVPGYGFDRVFGLRETWVHALENLDHSYHQVKLQSTQTIPLSMPSSQEGRPLTGAGSYYQCEVELAEQTEVLARFDEDGSPAITLARYGQGKAVWIGTMFAAAYWREGGADALAIYRRLLEEHLHCPPAVTVTPGTLRADWLSWDEAGERGAFLFVHNWGTEPASATIGLPAPVKGGRAWFAEGEPLLRCKPQSPAQVEVELAPGDIQVYEFDIQLCELAKEANR